MTDREAMKLALEALEFAAAQIYNEDNDDIIADAIIALRQSLEQPEQKPMMWIHRIIESGQPVATHVNQVPPEKYDSRWESLPLYAAPPKREWVGLTDEDIAQGAKQSWVDKQAFESAVWWAETKLREKNGF